MMPDSSLYQERLQAELDELILAIGEAGSAAGTVELDQTRVGRLSRMDALQQQAMAQGTRARLLGRKRRVEAALARITSGAYGRCCSCQELLPPQRLATDPAVVFCADCAEARETR
ncbi:MAG: TraR/DksA C4-type zinc finger protein [Chromatiales bacterium]|nr:TraR/DksA C4-type zinc finger protein [Chromatiales bacterium]MCK7582201.1 TraR/DksA C4-type zinc finger protein [Chromatiales bacterium]